MKALPTVASCLYPHTRNKFSCVERGVLGSVTNTPAITQNFQRSGQMPASVRSTPTFPKTSVISTSAH